MSSFLFPFNVSDSEDLRVKAMSLGSGDLRFAFLAENCFCFEITCHFSRVSGSVPIILDPFLVALVRCAALS